MTITYANGKIIEGVPLLKREDRFRVAVQGSEDVVEFTAENGIWFSEDLEPVLFEFAWERHANNVSVSEADCACPKELVSTLIRLLHCDSEDQYIEDRPKVLSMGASYC